MRTKGMINCNTEYRKQFLLMSREKRKSLSFGPDVSAKLAQSQRRQPPQLQLGEVHLILTIPSNLQFCVTPPLLEFPFANQRYHVLGMDNKNESPWSPLAVCFCYSPLRHNRFSPIKH